MKTHNVIRLNFQIALYSSLRWSEFRNPVSCYIILRHQERSARSSHHNIIFDQLVRYHRCRWRNTCTRSTGSLMPPSLPAPRMPLLPAPLSRLSVCASLPILCPSTLLRLFLYILLIYPASRLSPFRLPLAPPFCFPFPCLSLPSFLPLPPVSQISTTAL